MILGQVFVQVYNLFLFGSEFLFAIYISISDCLGKADGFDMMSICLNCNAEFCSRILKDVFDSVKIK